MALPTTAETWMGWGCGGASLWSLLNVSESSLEKDSLSHFTPRDAAVVTPHAGSISFTKTEI